MTPEELKEKIMELRCDKCEGTGTNQAAAFIDPCGSCEGTGFSIDETWDDIFEDM